MLGKFALDAPLDDVIAEWFRIQMFVKTDAGMRARTNKWTED